LTSSDTFEVGAKNTVTGEQTVLKTPRQGRNYNWADVTLEIYGIHQCNQFADGPMLFDEIALWDTEMKAIAPEWLLTTTKPCKGEIKLLHNGSFTVQHSTTGPP
jgi:hypothetical protein